MVFFLTVAFVNYIFCKNFLLFVPAFGYVAVKKTLLNI